MRARKFIQLYDSEKRPILDVSGFVSFDNRKKNVTKILSELKKDGKLPDSATFGAIHKLILNSVVKITGLIKIENGK